jgi:MFS family permease
VVFLVANSVGALLVARLLSGIASGIVAATATAALTELGPQGRSRRAPLTSTAANLGGLGLGTLFAGIVAQYGHDPTKLVFRIYLAALVPTLAALAVVTENRAPDRRPEMAPARSPDPGDRARDSPSSAARSSAPTP